MPEYSEDQIRDRVKSGRDAKRAAGADRLFAQATQPPHDDDAAALAKLSALAGDDSTGGYATNDARNYARMLLNSRPDSQPMEYSEARDGGGFLGSLGGVVKKLAPLAGFIPGIGVPLAAGVGAVGSAAGGAMQGDKFNLLKTLGAGAGAGAAAAWNPLGKKSPVEQLGGNGPAEVLSGGNSGQSLVSSGLTKRPGLIGQLGNSFKTPEGGFDFTKLANLGGKGMEIYGNNQTRRANERLANNEIALRTRSIEHAEDSYNQREPLRKLALERLGTMGSRGGSIFGTGR